MELAQARKARITPRMGGRILADALVAQGIDHVFEVPGESFLDTLDGLYDVRQKLKLVTCRFEAGAVNMAEAYGKLTGRPAAAFVTRGPGACHGAIGVHIAMQDSTPLLLFVGQIPHEDAGRDAFQEIDYRRMFSLRRQMGDADRPRQAHPGDRRARGGCRHVRPSRPGGDRAVGGDAARHGGSAGPAALLRVAPAHPDPAALLQLRAMLARSRRPVAVLGGSCWTDAGRAAIRDFLLGNEHSGHGRLPPPGAVRRHGGQLRRRSRRGIRSRADRQGEGGRPDPGDRQPARRRDVAGLHLARHGGQRADRAGASRRRRDRPRVPPGAGHRFRPEPLRRGGGGDGAGAAELGAMDAGAAFVAGGATRGAEL